METFLQKDSYLFVPIGSSESIGKKILGGHISQDLFETIEDELIDFMKVFIFLFC